MAIGVLMGMHDYYERLDSAGRVANKSADASILYNLACGFALIDSADQALHYLRTSVDEGWNDYYNLKRDSDMVSLWGMKQFQDLLSVVRERGDYFVTLRKAGEYHRTVPTRPSFMYQHVNDTNLVLLRTLYHLDSVAGTGNELSRIIRLMRWAHSVVRHDGQSQNPASCNAIDLIDVCRKEHRGVNCRMMATILNEAYLSMGFRSRHITCLPRDTTDTDCHVINIVYSNTLHKWIWMDPTFDAYITDKNGNFLNISEVRKKIISGDSVAVSDSINWNGQPYHKEDYLHYMAKNLFWFSAPVSSEFGYESTPGVKTYINLLPSSYNPHRKLMEAMNKPGGYFTNDADYFWSTTGN